MDCALFLMLNTSSSVVNKSFFNPPPSELLQPTRKDSPVKYAYYGTLEGAVIDHACALKEPDRLARLQEPVIDCNKNPSKSPLLCPSSPQLLANLLLFTLRTQDLVTACHEEKKRTVALHDDIYDEAYDCKDQQCAEDAINYGLLLVSRDLESAGMAKVTHAETPGIAMP